MGTIVLRPGREKPVLNHHPWIFSGAIGRIEGEPAGGDIVQVVDHQHRFLAKGYINRHSQITVRLLTWAAGSFEFHARLDPVEPLEAPLPLDVALLDAARLLDAPRRPREGAGETFRSYRDQADEEDEDLSIAAMERRHILRVLNETMWQRGLAADILGIHRTTLANKIREYQLADA